MTLWNVFTFITTFWRLPAGTFLARYITRSLLCCQPSFFTLSYLFLLLIIYCVDSFLADDQSVLSSLTTISNGSNTPSIVGETLGLISLSDHAHKKGNDIWIGKMYWGTGSIIIVIHVKFFFPLIAVIPATSVIEQKDLPQSLRTSLFSHVPPYIRFSTYEVMGKFFHIFTCILNNCLYQ